MAITMLLRRLSCAAALIVWSMSSAVAHASLSSQKHDFLQQLMLTDFDLTLPSFSSSSSSSAPGQRSSHSPESILAYRDFLVQHHAHADRNSPPSLDLDRRNHLGHRQPFGDNLFLSFLAFGHAFAFRLQVQHGLVGQNTTMDFYHHDGTLLAAVTPTVRSYTGFDAVWQATCHLTLYNHGVLHAVVASPSHFFMVDHENIVGIHSTAPLLNNKNSKNISYVAYKADHEKVLNPMGMEEEGEGEKVQHLAMVDRTSALHSLRNEGFDIHFDDLDSPAAAETATGQRKLLDRAPPLATQWADCYPGQSKPRNFLVGLALSAGYYQAWLSKLHDERYAGYQGRSADRGNGIADHLVSLLHDANIIYANQLNIYLVLTRTAFFTTTDMSSGEAPDPRWNLDINDQINSWAGAHGAKKGVCVVNGKVQGSSEVLESLGKWRRAAHQDDAGLWIVFTNCASLGKYMLSGLANVGCICSRGESGALIQFRDQTFTTWMTVAHEVGHTFGAHHSFEQGEGKTGGIMDYGDKKYQGVYQFNPLRKQEVCQQVSKVLHPSFANNYSAACFEPRVGEPRPAQPATHTPTPAEDPTGPGCGSGCGRNGFCMSSASGFAKCICKNQYSGIFCTTPPGQAPPTPSPTPTPLPPSPTPIPTPSKVCFDGRDCGPYGFCLSGSRCICKDAFGYSGPFCETPPGTATRQCSSHENGVCVARDGPQSLCASPSGIRVEGLCPASQICCLRAVRSSERSCDASGYTCMNVEVTKTECPMQQLSSGMCPGSSNVQCCIH